MRTRLRKALGIIILPTAVLLLTLPAATAFAGPLATDPTSLSTDVTSSTTDTVSDVTSSTTDTVADVTKPESPPDGSASPGSPTAGTDSSGVPEEPVTAADASGASGGPPTAKAFDDPTAPMPLSPLVVLANRGPARTGRPTAAMSTQPVCRVVNLHRDGGDLSLPCTEDPAWHGSAVLGLALAATGVALLLLVALALGFGVTGSGLLTAQRLLGRTSSAAAD
jgi:hypothetical protein